MVDTPRPNEQLDEVEQLRQRVAELEAMTANAPSFERDISQTIIDTTPAFFVIIDDDGKVNMMNKSMLATLGYSEEEIREKDYLTTFVPERERTHLSEIFQKELLKGKPNSNQNHILTKDGRELWVEWQGRPLIGPKGKVEAFCGIGLDVTERQKTQEAYRVLVDSALQALVIVQDARVVFTNPAAEALCGYTLQEFLQIENAYQALLHPDDLPDALKRNQGRLKGGTIDPRAVFRIVPKNGETRWVEAYTTKIDWNGRPALHTVFIDITERKTAEDELKRISQDENKRREELEKLREISANMRQAEGSNDLLRVFTEEVQKLCHADVASSVLFKAHYKPVTFFAPGANIKLSQEQSDAIFSALLDAEAGKLDAKIPGFESVLVLQLQSSEMVHGAVLVASYKQDVFTPDQQNMLNATTDMAGTALNRIDILETTEDRVRQRTRDLTVLYNLITIIAENWRLQDLLELSLVLTLETVKADRGIIYLLDNGKEGVMLKPVIQRGFGDGFQIGIGGLPCDELECKVFNEQKPLSLKKLADNPAFSDLKDIASYAGIPILARGEARGVISLFASKANAFGDEEMALLVSIADHLGIGIDNTILYEQSRESAALEERNRLARNLHDSVSQLLYGLTLMTGTTKRMLERGSDLETIKNAVERLGDTAHRALKEMRLLLFELRPAVLDSEGLVGALRHRIKTVESGLGLSVDLQADDMPELPNYVEDALYHIALEALNNIVKHADSKVATIKFTSDANHVVMEISDKGKGFDTDLLQNGLGLRTMRERGQMLDSEIVVESKPGQGTRVMVEVKLPSNSLVSS